MKTVAGSPENYINQLPENRKHVIIKLRKVIKDNLPGGFVETMCYGMIGFVVPYSLCSKGYHVNPGLKR